MFGLSAEQLIIILVVILIIFIGTQLPKLGRKITQSESSRRQPVDDDAVETKTTNTSATKKSARKA